jgi:hypothetical protein
MSVLDKKKKVFGNIAAARALTESMPKLRLSSSFPSINNKGDSITFLTDLIQSLIGYYELVNSVVDILTDSIDEIEVEVKKALKTELKSIVSCGVNPSLPSFIKSTGSGIVIEVKKIDFLNMLQTDPNTVSGKLLYNDVTSSLTNSSDFNTFLYGVIQDDGNTHTWANILDITFNSLGTGGNPNNTLTIKANSGYDSKTLNDLNNNYIDSLKLFNTENLVSRIIDTIFGSISFSIKKTRKQLEEEGKINAVIDKLTQSDEGETINDSYFTFDNDEVSKIQTDADNRKRGVIKVKTSNTIDASVPESSLTLLTDEMGTAVTVQDKKNTLSSNLDSMANQNTNNSTNPSDNSSIKVNFMQNIINTLIKGIVGVILSPKVVLIFLVNFKIIYGPTATYDNAIDFMKKNKRLIKAVIKRISTMIIKYLLSIALKRIAELVAQAQIRKQIDKNKNKVVQLLSLVGIPQEALRVIKGLT